MGPPGAPAGPISSADRAGEWEQCGQLCGGRLGPRPGAATGSQLCGPQSPLQSEGSEVLPWREWVLVRWRATSPWRAWSRGLETPWEECGESGMPEQFRKQAAVLRAGHLGSP